MAWTPNPARLCAAAALLVSLGATGCDPNDGEEHAGYVGLPRVAERLRVSRTELTAACGGGFGDFAAAASRALADEPGAERFASAAASYGVGGADPVSPEQIAEPGLARLLVERYAELCLSGDALEVVARVEDARLGGAEEHLERLRETLASGAPDGVTVETSACEGGLVEAHLPGELDEEAVDLLACARCPGSEGIAGPAQVAAGLAALRALAAAGLRPARTVRLRVCAHAVGDQPCGDCLASPRPPAASLALDGGSPLVIARFGEVIWDLSLERRPTSPLWLKAVRLRARAKAGRGSPRPLVLDVAAGDARSAVLPSEASMRLLDPASDAEALAARVREQAVAVAVGRRSARYEAEPSDEETVIVRALSEGGPAHGVAERGSALCDLAALAVALDVDDPPGGSLADVLRSVARLDGDPEGRRLGLYYESPGVGGLLLAPTSIRAEDRRVVLGLRMYRPPGLDERAFGVRLDDARARLSSVAGQFFEEARRDLGSATGVELESPIVRVVQRSFEDVTGERVRPTADPYPGMSSSVEGAVTVGLPPPEPGGPALRPEAVVLVVDLVWQLAVAVDPEVARASRWR